MNKKIQRYKVERRPSKKINQLANAWMGKNEEGKWVLYKDHVEVIEEIIAERVAEARNEILQKIMGIDGGFWGDDSPLWKVTEIFEDLPVGTIKKVEK